MRKVEAIKVTLWGHDVGYLALLRGGSIAFEYAPEFKALGLEIAPLEMPLATTATYLSPEVSTTFQRLPGVIADCLPDQFGTTVIHAFFKCKYGWEPPAVSALDRLLYIGDRAIGALEFTPAIDDTGPASAHMELQALAAMAKATLEGKAEQLPVEILRLSASSGGRQAKALIDFNPAEGTLRHGFSQPAPGFVPCLIKFDGARDGDPSNVFGRLEFVYAQLARDCGIDMPKTYLLEGEGEEGQVAHFVVERFDRDEGKRKTVHFASLCGLLNRDFRVKHSASYEDFLRVTHHLSADLSQVEQAFRRMVFNIILRNQDDHTKNVGFVMNRNGSWQLAPAFDLTYVYGHGVASTHQMTLGGKDDLFTLDDMREIGKRHGLKWPRTRSIVEQVTTVANSFLSMGVAHGLEEAFAAGISSRFRMLLL